MVVVLNKEDYLSKAYRQLDNTDHYRKLSSDPTATLANDVKQAVLQMFRNDSTDKHAMNFLTPKNPRMAIFYLLSKIHKPGNPGRPIISSCGTATENISKYVDHFLQPLATQVPSYIRDTTDFC